ncbi:MAG: hypothetical protein AUH88_01985 [Acidobacteria bacterium 13_1_40CM_4_61_5]|nr:MAG: hypothetical protein AUH88_01985 [Acidobacteria bacterium 13_1_40CM_4_61_5]
MLFVIPALIAPMLLGRRYILFQNWTLFIIHYLSQVSSCSKQGRRADKTESPVQPGSSSGHDHAGTLADAG